MSKQEHTEKIIQLLEEVVARTNLISKYPERELCLEVDLVMEDLRRLYRHYSMLKNICEQGHGLSAKKRAALREEHVPSFFTDPEPPAESKPRPDSHHEPLAGSKPQSHTDPEPPQKSVDQASPASQSAKESMDQASPASQSAKESMDQASPASQSAKESVDQEPPVRMEPPTVMPSPTHSAQPAPRPVSKPVSSKGSNGKSVIDMFAENQAKSIGDKLGGEDNSLHQRISSQKEDKSIGARLQHYPISNLREAIGLNEKFLFINELFNGDIEAYNDAINKLNDIGSVKQAFDYLNTLTGIYGWDAGRSAETIEKLANFVQRRYMSSQP